MNRFVMQFHVAANRLADIGLGHVEIRSTPSNRSGGKLTRLPPVVLTDVPKVLGELKFSLARIYARMGGTNKVGTRLWAINFVFTLGGTPADAKDTLALAKFLIGRYTNVERWDYEDGIALILRSPQDMPAHFELNNSIGFGIQEVVNTTWKHKAARQKAEAAARQAALAAANAAAEANRRATSPFAALAALKR